jgi:hypothetical protein
MVNNFDVIMSKKTNQELIVIVTTDRLKYQESAIISSEREIEKRNIDKTIISDINERIEIEKSEELKSKDDYKVENQEIINLNKFIILSIISFGAYEIWWMYKAWRFFKQKEKLEIFPGARAIFCVFFLNSLFNKILEFAKEKGYSNNFSSSTLFICFLIANLLAKLPDPFWLISIFSFVFIIPPFEALNYAKQKSTNIIIIDRTGFNGRQITLIVLGTIFWALTIWGMTTN